jgi:aryl-alcohol dehydrogenase-like predicted oxidoreductase
MTISQRKLGRSNIMVGDIGLGCMGMSWAYGSAADRDDDTSIAVIHRALDTGCTLIDTSDVYGPFTNEILVGRALKDRRDDAVIATKCGLVMADPGTGRMHPDGRPMHIAMACDSSLSRLGIDVIDLYQLHRPDPTVPVAESIGAMGELVTQGKVRAIGVSEFNVAQLEEAQRTFPIVSLQSELSLWTRDVLAEILPWCVANDVAFIPFSPLGRGFLTGALSSAASEGFAAGDFRSRNPRFTAEAMTANQAIVDAVAAIATRLGCSPGQVAIAWTLAQGDQVIPIPGTKRLAYLDDNLGASAITLTSNDLAELDALPSASGTRY